MNTHKKAFTLSELLVVVIVLGILSSVAVPKFVRVLETRKTTEAESVLSALRTEQEARCVLGKNYQTDAMKVSAVSASKNYAFSLQGSGATARSVKDYAIRMPSYKDGSLCCEGSYCAKLNKSYPDCATLARLSDECAGEVSCSGSVPSSSASCGCLGKGVKTRSVTCDTYDGSWQTGAWGGCSIPDACPCDSASKPVTSEPCGCLNKGTKTRSVTCNSSNGTWTVGNWGACSIPDACPCDNASKPVTSEPCGCLNKGTKTRSVTCNSSNGTWTVGNWGSCSIPDACPCDNASKPITSEPCGCKNGGTRTRSVSCNSSNGTWTVGNWSACSIAQECSCDNASKPVETQSCGNCGRQTRTVTCDTSTGTWKPGNWSACSGQGECAAGSTESVSCGEEYNGMQSRTCSAQCRWGGWDQSACSPKAKECPAASKPAETQPCGNCSKGVQQRSVTCDTTTGTWQTGEWSACDNGRWCKQGDSRLVGDCRDNCYEDADGNPDCQGEQWEVCNTQCIWVTDNVNSKCEWSGRWRKVASNEGYVDSEWDCDESGQEWLDTIDSEWTYCWDFGRRVTVGYYINYGSPRCRYDTWECRQLW